MEDNGNKTYILFSIAALSRMENISHVNTRDDRREPTNHLDQPVYLLLVVPIQVEHNPPKRAAQHNPHKGNPLAIRYTW